MTGTSTKLQPAANEKNRDLNTLVLAPFSSRIPVYARFLLNALPHCNHGSIELELPEGSKLKYCGKQCGPHAHFKIHDWAVIRKLAHGSDIGLAETFLEQRWHSNDITSLLRYVMVNEKTLDCYFQGNLLVQWWYKLRQMLNANTRKGSRRNIRAHYDLGNHFYQLWLDPGMTYSSAVFNGNFGQNLEQAQRDKYERILATLNAKKDDSILEIGCGWGGFAEYAARTRGCRVYGITLSSEQLHYARQRIELAGLSDQVTLDLCDYRDIADRHTGTDKFDHVVSIEMIEAVGEHRWGTYFDTLRQQLKPNGTAVIQTITIDNGVFHGYRKRTDFIQRYIFPGGMLPSPAILNDYARQSGLKQSDRYDFGQDYAETLRRWRVAFNARWTEVKQKGFDERFRRLWNFYLHYCEAGFIAERISVTQVAFRHI